MACEFKTSLDYTARPCLEKNKPKRKDKYIFHRNLQIQMTTKKLCRKMALLKVALCSREGGVPATCSGPTQNAPSSG